jgi:hypothetical protein
MHTFNITFLPRITGRCERSMLKPRLFVNFFSR